MKSVWLGAWLASLSLTVLADTHSVVTQAGDWQTANQHVAQFPRGHADIVKWEAQHAAIPPATTPPHDAAVLPLASAAEAVRLAWQAHPSLMRPLAKLGNIQQNHIAEGQWLLLTPQQYQRIDHAEDVWETAYEARRAWVLAVAAEQMQRYQADALSAVEAAAELGQRMAKVGNWSQLQAAQQQAMLLQAKLQTQRSQYQAKQQRQQLQQVLKQWVVSHPQPLTLPARLPDVPKQALSAHEFQQHLQQVLQQLPRKEQLATQANAEFSYQAYLTAYQQASSYQTQIVPLQQQIHEETLLRYNGMLLSTWDLLAETRNRAQTIRDAIEANRDFWLAEMELLWVLQGNPPKHPIQLSSGSAGAPAGAAAH